MQRRGTGLMAAVVATLGLTLSAPAAFAGERDRACAWTLEPTADRENVLFPEITTRYLGGVVPVPPGGAVEITGQFPHARYISFQTYSAGLQVLSAIYDAQILPDPGSSNPYVPRADRTAAHRNYTVRLVAGRPPAGGGPPNTIYDTNPDGSQSGHGLAYRIYLPDHGSGPFGGVAAPDLTLVLADGSRIPLPRCPDPGVDTGTAPALAGLGLAASLPAAGLLAYSTPVWHKYVNAPTSYALGFTDNDRTPPGVGDAVAGVTQQLPSGLGENAHNKYVYTYLSQEYGQVAVFHAKLPTTPRTYDGERRMGSGQLRFWSMCTGNRTTQSIGCLVDKDVPVDRNRVYTIAISTRAARPANAVAACGVAWLPWGPEPKGIVLMRNMLPAPDFANAIQNATPGTELQTLGSYYPVGRYYTTTKFEQLGCPRRAKLTRPASSPPRSS
jgi:hypothetical protein